MMLDFAECDRRVWRVIRAMTDGSSRGPHHGRLLPPRVPGTTPIQERLLFSLRRGCRNSGRSALSPLPS